MRAPLSGTRVVDFTHTIAGPMCTELLSAFGAEVIKVEPPGGELGREFLKGAPFTSLNLDKKSVSVDLREPDGIEVAQDLVRSSDVVVENFRPGKLDQYDLDYENLVEINDDLVYCSITGFGQDGPYRDNPAYDPVVQAMSGIMAGTGNAEAGPARVGTSAIDYGTGTTAAFLISMALLERSQTGESTYIDVSLYDVAVSWMGYWIAQYTNDGSTPQRNGAALHGSAPNDIYEVGTSDRLFLSAPNDTFFERLCEAVGHEALVDDQRFATNESRWEHNEELKRELEDAFSDYTVRELHDLLSDAGVPSAPVQDIATVVDSDPHVQARRMTVPTYNRTTDAAVKTAALPYRIDGERTEFESQPPRCGEDAFSVLADIGYDDDAIEDLFSTSVLYLDD